MGLSFSFTYYLLLYYFFLVLIRRKSLVARKLFRQGYCCNLALRLKKYLSTKLNCFLAYYTSFLMVDHLRLSGRYLNKRTSITNVVDSL